MRRKLAFCTSAAAIALLSSAQAAVAAGAADKGALVEEVLVTGTKRTTALQDTPVAITAISSATLEQEHVNTVADVTRLVPSFAATTEGDHGVITMTMRGIGNDSAKTEYADPEVALFVDGIYTPRAEGASSLLFDLDSVEVLRGPQGTLWGRNSTVGAVNMQTAKPVLGDSFGNIMVGGGTYNRVGARGAVNIPVSDNFALRIAFAKEQHDGYVKYQTPKLPSIASQQAAYIAGGGTLATFKPINAGTFVQSGPRYSAQDQAAVRVSALYKPSDSLAWNVSYEYFQDRGTPGMNLMQQPRAGEDFWSALIDVAPYLHRDVHAFRSNLNWDLSDKIALSYIAGYTRFDGSSNFDQDGGAHIPTSFATGATYQEDRTNNSRYSNFSHEVSLKSKGENTVDWILGLYYASEDNSIRFDIPIFNGTKEGTVGWQGSFIQPKETVRSKAVFGQATWHMTDNFRLTGGLRYTDDQRANKGGTNNAWAYNAAVPQVPLDPGTNPLTSAAYTTYQHNDGKYSDSKATWLARADYDVSHDFLIYASVSSGYKSGGLQDGGVPYGPETLINYEIGTKMTLLDGRMTFNNALFYEDFQDFQFSAPVTFAGGNRGLATSNADGAKVKGFESEITFRPTAKDTLQVAASFLNTKLGKLLAGSNDYSNLPVCPDKSISNPCMDVTGHKLPHAPNAAFQVVYQHEFDLPNGGTFSPRISSHFETASWLSVFNDGAGDKQKAYHRTDLNLVYKAPGDRPWSIELFAQNLEDGRIKTNAGVTGDNIFTSQYLPPRTVGANLRVDF